MDDINIMQGGENMDIKNHWQSHIETMANMIDMDRFTSKDLAKWMKPLIQNITSDGAVPYLIGVNERYRASPLASSISWLEKANLLPIDVLTLMREKLIDLRDKNIPSDNHPGNAKKKDDDEHGWSLGEGVSVWSTSCAIEAILDLKGNGRVFAPRIKNSVLWLAKQRKPEGGWGYQYSVDCEDNCVMTALALRALALAYSKPNIEAFGYTAEEKRDMENAITSGYNYLKDKCVSTKKETYWCFKSLGKSNPHCAATTWGMLALKYVSNCEIKIARQCEEFYKEKRKTALSFICSKMPKDESLWAEELFVQEGGAKYDKQKNYSSFSPTLLPQLFEIGLSPFHSKVIRQVRWLLNNPDEWKIQTYSKSKECYFTYAMVISTIIAWYQKVGSEFACVLTKERKTDFRSRLFGYPFIRRMDVQMISHERLAVAVFAFAFLLIHVFLGNQFDLLIEELLGWLKDLWSNTEQERYDILISIFSDAVKYVVIAGFSYIISVILKKVRGGHDD